MFKKIFIVIFLFIFVTQTKYLNMNLTKIDRTTDYINFDQALNVGKNLMKTKKTEILGFYIILSINTGLRASDTKRITFENIRDGGELQVWEKKTNKFRRIELNGSVMDAFNKLTVRRQTGLIFISQKNTVYSTQHLNRLLKNAFFTIAQTQNISTHSLRKTFGRRVYENNGKTEDALVELSDIFNHSTISLTRIYLGISRERIKNIYLNL